MSHELKKDWITDAGYRAVILFVHDSNHCGYVAIPPGHPLYGKDYSDPSGFGLSEGTEIGKRGLIAVMCFAADPDMENVPVDMLINVHGGITYARGGEEYPIGSSEECWWFGYDCAHSGDRCMGSLSFEIEGDVFRDVDYCVRECESLAAQLKQLEAKP